MHSVSIKIRFRIRTFTIAFLVIICTEATSQTFDLGFQSGIGYYAMPRLEKLNNSIHQNMDFNNEIVTSFPSYYYFRPMFIVRTPKFNYGVMYSFHSTGSRISSQDFSANYRFDMLAKSHFFGYYIDAPMAKFERLNVNIYTNIGFALSQLLMEEVFILNNATIANTHIKFKSENLFFEPGITVNYQILNFLSVRFNAGYTILPDPNPYYAKGSKFNMFYLNGSDIPLTPEWEGLRVGVGLMVKIH